MTPPMSCVLWCAGMVNSRVKGSTAEREVAAILFDWLGLTFKRDLEQYRSADRGDLLCDEMDFPAVIEVKRYAKGTQAQPRWWGQVCKASKTAGKWPLLVYRYDRQDWRWRMPAQALVDLGIGINYRGARPDAEYDWAYAVEMDTRTAMTFLREMISNV